MGSMQLFIAPWMSEEGEQLRRSVRFLMGAIGSQVPTDVIVETIHANVINVVSGLPLYAVVSCLQNLCGT